MKREKIRQIFKERFEDFDADNNCVTTFVIGKYDGLWCVKLSCSIDIIEAGKGLNGDKYLYDIDGMCFWVGDFFNCSVDIGTIKWNRKFLYVYFIPLNDIN